MSAWLSPAACVNAYSRLPGMGRVTREEYEALVARSEGR
jgi:hypothetical protein